MSTENSNVVKPIKPSRSMKRSVIPVLVLGLLCLLGAPSLLAAEPTETVETRLRERLRDTLLQLRDAQTAAETNRAALEVAQTESAAEIKVLNEKLAAITKEANANSQAARALETLKTQVARQEKEIAGLQEAADNCRQAAELAHNRAEEWAKRVDEAVIELERLLSDRQAKNLALYKTACEVLQRYQQFSLGEALKSREPFVGITRVKLQNLVQDYQDKLASERTTLDTKDLESYQGKLRDQPPSTPGPGSKAPGQTSE